MIDYKILGAKQFLDGSWRIAIAVFRGNITTLDEGTPPKPVTRYRRSELLERRRFSVPAGYTIEQIRKKINDKLAQKALQIGETIISEQIQTLNSSDLNTTITEL